MPKTKNQQLASFNMTTLKQLIARLKEAGWTEKKGLWRTQKRGLKRHTQNGLLIEEAASLECFSFSKELSLEINEYYVKAFDAKRRAAAEPLIDATKVIGVDQQRENKEDPRFAETFFVVEASSFEKQKLWEENKARRKARKPFNQMYVEWEQGRSGVGICVGMLAEMPVNISVIWDKLDGKTICFWEAVSPVVDYRMIEKFFEKNCNPKWDNGTRQARVNVDNFHHCLHAIKGM